MPYKGFRIFVAYDSNVLIYNSHEIMCTFATFVFCKNNNNLGNMWDAWTSNFDLANPHTNEKGFEGVNINLNNLYTSFCSGPWAIQYDC